MNKSREGAPVVIELGSVVENVEVSVDAKFVVEGSFVLTDVAAVDVAVDVMAVDVGVAVVVVVSDLGKLSTSATIVLRQILINKMFNPSAILGYFRFTLFKQIMRKFREVWGGFGGGIDGGGGSLSSISSYKAS